MKPPKPSYPPVFKDKRGTELKPGDLICYSHLLGRSAGLKFGKVVSVDWSGDPAYNHQRHVYEHCPRLKVRGVEESWKGKLELGKIGTLQYEDRVLKVAPEQVHPAHLELLATVEIPS